MVTIIIAPSIAKGRVENNDPAAKITTNMNKAVLNPFSVVFEPMELNSIDLKFYQNEPSHFTNKIRDDTKSLLNTCLMNLNYVNLEFL